MEGCSGEGARSPARVGWRRRGSALGEVALGDGEVPGELLVSVSRQEKEDGGEKATGREGAC